MNLSVVCVVRSDFTWHFGYPDSLYKTFKFLIVTDILFLNAFYFCRCNFIFNASEAAKQCRPPEVLQDCVATNASHAVRTKGLEIPGTRQTTTKPFSSILELSRIKVLGLLTKGRDRPRRLRGKNEKQRRRSHVSGLIRLRAPQSLVIRFVNLHNSGGRRAATRRIARSLFGTLERPSGSWDQDRDGFEETSIFLFI